MKRILAGYSHFKKSIYPQKRLFFEGLKGKQHPQALLITCADSRIVPDLIMQSDPGDLFICRNAGNMVPPHGDSSGGVGATIEYAVGVLGVQHIIICGHSDCGAMHGVLHPEMVQNLPSVAQWLRHADVARNVVRENYHHLSEAAAQQMLTCENVIAQLNNLRTHPSVAPKVARGDLQLHGWMYQIDTAEIRAFDADRWQFVPLDNKAFPAVEPHPLLEQAS